MILKDYINYYFRTKKRAFYKKVGERYGVGGFHVYQLAHGKAAYSVADHKILELLVDESIISGVGV